MGKLMLIWIGLPLVIKVFLFIILLYLYLMLCMQLYTRCETIINRVRMSKYDRKKEEYMELIKSSLAHIEEGTQEENQEIIGFLNKLQKKKDTYLLDLWIYYGVLKIREVTGSQQMTQEAEEKKKNLLRYFHYQELYKDVAFNKRRYGDLNALIMLGELRDKRSIPDLDEYQNRFKEELNFYFGYNIVLAYAKLGDFNGFIKSYRITNIPNEVHDDGLYVYILNCYEGNRDELVKHQIEALKGMELNQSILAIKYFESNRYAEVWQVVLEKMQFAIGIYLEDKSNIRVLDMAMAAIRYFLSIDRKEADEYILTLVDCPIWEIQIVALNYLIKLDKSMVAEIFLEKIKDSNWQIRHNSAKALVKIKVGKDKRDMILNGDDLYAKEALEYAIEKRVGKYELD